MVPVACAPADHLALLLDDAIRRHGGGGNRGQLRLHLGQPLEPAVRDRLVATWCDLGRRLPLLRARSVCGWRGWRLAVPPPAPLPEPIAITDLESTADRLLEAGAPAEAPLVRLALAPNGVLLEWHHALADARGIQQFAVGLARAVAGESVPTEPWWRPHHRRGGPPAPWRQRAPAARTVPRLVAPWRTAGVLRPVRSARARPLVSAGTVFTVAETAAIAARSRSAAGRLGETAFLLAAWAAVLADRCPGEGVILLPVAADHRHPDDSRVLVNASEFLHLACPAATARAGLVAAARAFKASHKEWLRGGGPAGLAAGLDAFPYLPRPLVRRELGWGAPGLACSSFCANAGASPIGETWCGAPVRALHHALALPGTPGLAALAHRHGGCLVVDCLAAGPAVRAHPPVELVAELRHQLLERPLEVPP